MSPMARVCEQCGKSVKRLTDGLCGRCSYVASGGVIQKQRKPESGWRRLLLRAILGPEVSR